jgi:hypothetical protein
MRRGDYLPFGRFAEGLGGEWIWGGTSEAIVIIMKVKVLLSGSDGKVCYLWYFGTSFCSTLVVVLVMQAT